MKTIETNILGRDVIIEISILDNFIECDKKISSPLNESSMKMFNDYNPEEHSSTILKIKASDNDLQFLLGNSPMAFHFYDDAVSKYLKNFFDNKEFGVVEAIICNQFESQTKYYIR